MPVSIDQQLVRRAAGGNAVRAEHRLREVVRGHHADVDAIARPSHRRRRPRRRDAMGARGRDLVRHQVVAGHGVTAGHEPPRERLAHQPETDEADPAFAYGHVRSSPACGSGGDYGCRSALLASLRTREDGTRTAAPA
jgi:hypothetical protein